MDLEKLKALADAATPGPWEIRPPIIAGNWPQVSWRKSMACFPPVAHVMHDSDSAFIAAAREAVPALVAEVELLRAETVSLRDRVESGDIEEPWRREVERLRADNARLAASIDAATSIGQKVLDWMESDDDALCDERADAAQSACEQMISMLSGTGAVIVEGGQ